jgi:outer membrane protein
MIRRILLSGILLLLFLNHSFSQNWDLRACVEYAMANNIQVRLTDVQAKISEVTLQQNRQSMLPSANFNSSMSYNSGLNQNPITFSRVTETYLTAGFQLQSSADIFNFFSRQNSIAAAKWETMAAKANVDKVKYDIALAVANAYLQVLLNREQEKIATLQVEQTKVQLANTRKMVKAGSVPELSASQLEAQLAQDSANIISAKSGALQALLNLQSLMNLDPAQPFEISTPPVELIPVESIADLQPEYVYGLAISNQPLQRVNTFRLKAAAKNMLAAKSSMLPTLTLFGSLGSSYFNKAQELKGTTQVFAPIGKVDINNTSYQVFPLQPYTIGNYGKSSFNSQLGDNFRQAAGIALSVPIHNGRSLKSNYERSNLTVQSIQLQQDQDNYKLKQDIYQAYQASLVALERFNASQRSVETNTKAFSFASKRYEVGMLSTLEWITAQNNLFRAKLEYTLNRFDYVFKLKVLEYYKGLGLKL